MPYSSRSFLHVNDDDGDKDDCSSDKTMMAELAVMSRGHQAESSTSASSGTESSDLYYYCDRRRAASNSNSNSRVTSSPERTSHPLGLLQLRSVVRRPSSKNKADYARRSVFMLSSTGHERTKSANKLQNLFRSRSRTRTSSANGADFEPPERTQSLDARVHHLASPPVSPSKPSSRMHSRPISTTTMQTHSTIASLPRRFRTDVNHPPLSSFDPPLEVSDPPTSISSASEFGAQRHATGSTSSKTTNGSTSSRQARGLKGLFGIGAKGEGPSSLYRRSSTHTKPDTRPTSPEASPAIISRPHSPNPRSWVRKITRSKSPAPSISSTTGVTPQQVPTFSSSMTHQRQSSSPPPIPPTITHTPPTPKKPASAESMRLPPSHRTTSVVTNNGPSFNISSAKKVKGSSNSRRESVDINRPTSLPIEDLPIPHPTDHHHHHNHHSRGRHGSMPPAALPAHARRLPSPPPPPQFQSHAHLNSRSGSVSDSSGHLGASTSPTLGGSPGFKNGSWGRRAARIGHGAFSFESPVPSSPSPNSHTTSSSSAEKQQQQQHEQDQHRGRKGRSLDLGLGLMWAPTKVREEALLPVYGRIRGSVNDKVDAGAAGTVANGLGPNAYNKTAGDEWRRVLGEDGYEKFERYLRRFEEGKMPFETLVSKVERLLEERGAARLGSRERRAMLEGFVRGVLAGAGASRDRDRKK